MALLWGAVPELKGNVKLTAYILQETATPLDALGDCFSEQVTPNNVFGHGSINVFNAYCWAEEYFLKEDIAHLQLRIQGIHGEGSKELKELCLSLEDLTEAEMTLKQRCSAATISSAPSVSAAFPSVLPHPLLLLLVRAL